ncbi:MAG: septum formation initiator family protein [Dehalobacterium sp.]
MKNKNKAKVKYRVKKRFFLLFVIFSYVAVCFGQQFYRMNNIDKEIDNYLHQKNGLIKEQEDLKAEIALLENESYIERIAREDLGLIKPGETLLVPGERGNLPEVKSMKELENNIH